MDKLLDMLLSKELTLSAWLVSPVAGVGVASLETTPSGGDITSMTDKSKSAVTDAPNNCAFCMQFL